MATDHFGMDICVRFGDSRSNCSRNSQAALFVMADVAYDKTLGTILVILASVDLLIQFAAGPEAAGDVISGTFVRR